MHSRSCQPGVGGGRGHVVVLARRPERVRLLRSRRRGAVAEVPAGGHGTPNVGRGHRERDRVVANRRDRQCPQGGRHRVPARHVQAGVGGGEARRADEAVALRVAPGREVREEDARPTAEQLLRRAEAPAGGTPGCPRLCGRPAGWSPGTTSPSRCRARSGRRLPPGQWRPPARGAPAPRRSPIRACGRTTGDRSRRRW